MKGLGISVAMCTYNGSAFLPEQLESIADQTRLPDELIVCDDYSTDDTVEVIHAFARRAPFEVRLYVNENNLGITNNFANAIGLCTKEIIALADQDDIWLPEKLDRIAEVFGTREEIAAVFSDAELIDRESCRISMHIWESFYFTRREQERFANGQALNILLKHPVVTGAAMAFRRDFCELLLPIPPNALHDYWISLLIATCGKIEMIRDSLMQYRKHDGQQIGAGTAGLPLAERAQIARKTTKGWYLSEIEGFGQLCERLDARAAQFPSRKDAIELIQKKISHREIRARFPHSRFLRIPAVVGELMNGGYWRYSGGWKSVAKDLIL